MAIVSIMFIICYPICFIAIMQYLAKSDASPTSFMIFVIQMVVIFVLGIVPAIIALCWNLNMSMAFSIGLTFLIASVAWTTVRRVKKEKS